MKRSMPIVATTIVLLLSLTVAAVAQERRGGRRGRSRGANRPLNAVTLLASDQVREELKIAEEQVEKVDAILSTYRQDTRDLRSGLRDLSDEEREARRVENREKSEALRITAEGKLEEALGEDQMKRLREITLQQQGIDALVTANIVETLKLDDNQVKTIRNAIKTRDEATRTLWTAARDSFRGGNDGGDFDFEGMREKREKLRKDAEIAALGVLSDAQTASLTNLKGEPFELDRRSLMRGRRGGHGGRGGRRPAGGKKRPPLDDPEA